MFDIPPAIKIPKYLSSRYITAETRCIDKFGCYPYIFDSIEDVFLIKAEKGGCEIKNKSKIKEFLMQNDGSINLIESAILTIHNHFGYTQKIGLELFFDPEDDASHPVLFINILSEEEPEKVMDKFDLVNHWFVDNIYVKNFSININIDFI